ncbi:MAG: YciI family protein [Nitrospirae bacterium]|nr:YciI family protein [Nitrospirota bacterium]MDA8339317.1 YciI family protein [Nitrospiraceae bacterium]
MGKRFVFFYFMKKEPEKIRAVVPSHIEYWKTCNLKEYLGGPFSDKSGGLISFEAENLEEATRIIMNDPFVLQGLLENKWVKEWAVE